MALHACICMYPYHETNMFENSSNLLHMELTRIQVHKYDFSNCYGQPLHVDVVQIRITVIKWLGNHLNVFKRSNDPWNFPNFHMTVCISAHYT